MWLELWELSSKKILFSLSTLDLKLISTEKRVHLQGNILLSHREIDDYWFLMLYVILNKKIPCESSFSANLGLVQLGASAKTSYATMELF